MLENGNRNSDDTVTKSLDSWKFTAKNTLMYIPEGVPLTDEEQLEKCKRSRVINHSNTRFSTEMLKSLNQTSSNIHTPGTQNKLNPTISVIAKVGVDGKEAVSSDTPKVRGYSFVDASPSPMPGRSIGDESPMMMWGEIESTPFRLEGSATPFFGGGPEFKIPEVLFYFS
jgi:protein DGCR14